MVFPQHLQKQHTPTNANEHTCEIFERICSRGVLVTEFLGVSDQREGFEGCRWCLQIAADNNTLLSTETHTRTF